MLQSKVIFCLLSAISIGIVRSCSEITTKAALKKPIYDFSVNLLDKVAFQTKEHFVFSPIFTWLQLISLAEGARLKTLQEIWQVTGLTGHRKKTCYRRKFREMVNKMQDELGDQTQISSLIIIDKFYKVKKGFKSEVESLHSAKVVSVNFDDAEQSAQYINDIIEEKLQGNLESVVLPSDFYQSFLIFNDAAYLKNNWKFPFNKAYTKSVKFFSEDNVDIGDVNMMNQVGYLELVTLPIINAKILKLPCDQDRISMLVYLPFEKGIEYVFYKLKDTTLTGILNKLKIEGPKAVNVSLPNFNIETEVPNIQEFLYDMGLKRALYPEEAQLKDISNYTISVSLMSQAVGIEVTETGVHASVTSDVESILADPAEDFNANKPFAFMLIDELLEVILFAGIFSDPMKESL